MTISIERHGLTVDGVRYPCTVRQRMSGGNLRVDKQEERGEDEPSSKVVWEYDGWQPRILQLSISASTATASGDGDVRPALSALMHRAARRGTEPQLHQLRGTMLRAAGATDSDWLLTGEPDWDDDGTTNELALTVELAEFDPEIATLRAATATVPATPEPDPELADGLSDEDRALLGVVNAQLLEAQQFGPGF